MDNKNTKDKGANMFQVKKQNRGNWEIAVTNLTYQQAREYIRQNAPTSMHPLKIEVIPPHTPR